MAFVRHITLVANTVSTVTLTDNSSSVEILSRNGLDEVFVSFDGTAAPVNPTVAGNDFDVVPAAIGAALAIRRPGSAAIVLKLISASATTVSVRGVP